MRYLLSLLLAANAWAQVFAPVLRDYTYEFTLFDGASIVTGATVTVSIGKDTNSNGIDDAWWNGSAWTTYGTVAMTERTGNVSLEGKYGYTLSTTAIGAIPGRFHFSSKYTSGSLTIYNRETLYTTMPNTAEGGGVRVEEVVATAVEAITDGVWDEPRSGHTTSGTFGEYLDAQVSTAGGGATAQEIWEYLLGSSEAGDLLSGVYSRVGSATITVVSSVASSGTITVIQGDDYSGASVLSLSRTWPGVSMVGGTVAFYVIPTANYTAGTGTATLGPVACTFTGGGSGATITVSVPLTAAQTAALNVSPPQNPLNYTYQVVGTASGGTKHTLFLGAMTVKRGLQ